MQNIVKNELGIGKIFLYHAQTEIEMTMILYYSFWKSEECLHVNSRIYTDDYLVVATTITSARLLSSQCKRGKIVRLLSSRARLSSRRYSRQNVSSDGHLRYLRKWSDQCKFGRLL